MKWGEYYNRFWEWSDSTRISRISTLTDFYSPTEVAEIVVELLRRESRRPAGQARHAKRHTLYAAADR